MFQEGAPIPPMTPAACLPQDIARVPITPISPPGYFGGVQPGSPPRASPPPPQPPAGDGSAWSYVRQIYRSTPHAAQAVEVQPLPTSAGVSEHLYINTHRPHLTTSGPLGLRQVHQLLCQMQEHVQL